MERPFRYLTEIAFVGCLFMSNAQSAAAEQKILTFDALPRGAAFSSYTEEGITFAGNNGETVFSTTLNPQNGTTAVEITSSNAVTYSISMGGRYFSLRSFNVVVPASGRSVIRSAFGSRSDHQRHDGCGAVVCGF